MAKDYLDLISELCNELDLGTGLYPDGDNPGLYVLRADSWRELRELNAALKQRFAEMGVDASKVEQWHCADDDGYVEFALGDNSLAFYDDSFVCDECYQCYDTSGYGYTNYFIEDGMIYCEECVKADPQLQEDYVGTLINQPKRANTLLSEDDMIGLGFTHLEDEYENGYYGRVDDPEQILNDILAENPNADVVFDIIQNGNPWATSFTVWVR